MTHPLKLPLLEPHRSTLEKCVYCPKLSRASCPVSNAEGSETVTPWGKMSMAYFAGRGDVPIDRAHAEPAWACTSCFACKERCDHRNEVATVLNLARAEMFSRGAAPVPAREAAARWEARAADAARAIEAIEAKEAKERTALGGPAAMLLVGCSYARRAPSEAGDAIRATAALTGRDVRAVRSCCGLPLLYAGDLDGFRRAAQKLAAEVAHSSRLIAVDPGCARALLVEYKSVGVDVTPPELFVDLAASNLDRLSRAQIGPTSVRYHDPCQLGRGLDRYDAPRAVIAHITGAAPEEFIRSRAQADCSGGGGLLPLTRPASSRAIADARVAEHRELGGGALVTACAQSLRRFRASGEAAIDVVSLVARAALPR